MIDIDLSFRNMYGNVTFGIKSKSVTGIELLVQKITILLLSENSSTYFNNIVGGDLLSAGKYSFSENSYDNFKLTILDNLNNIVKKIRQEEVDNNIDKSDRIKNLSLKDILYDKVTTKLSISLLLSTNSDSTSFSLPVK